MRRLGVRLLMAIVGVTIAVAYFAAATIGYLGLRWLWVNRPDLPTVVAIVAGVTLLSTYLSYRLGTAQLLAALEAGRISRDRAPGVHRRLDELAARMNVDRPALYVADMRAPNALAVGGSDRGALVLDRSLFRLLDPAELEGIMAHELAHLERNDGLLLSIVSGVGQTVSGLLMLVLLPAVLALSGLSRGFAWVQGRPFDRGGPFVKLRRGLLGTVVITLLVVTLLVRARSRRREFAADDRAVAVTGDPMALARALRKIERVSEPWLFAPLSGNRETDDPIQRWFATHPPTDERIERLIERANAERERRAREGWTRITVQ